MPLSVCRKILFRQTDRHREAHAIEEKTATGIRGYVELSLTTRVKMHFMFD